MSNLNRFLLINSSEDDYWWKVLRESLSPEGSIDVSKEDEALERFRAGKYDLLIIDESAVESVPHLISRLRSGREETRIIVATASPTWRRAREAYQAGAMDYISKTLVSSEIRNTIRSVLTKSPPPLV